MLGLLLASLLQASSGLAQAPAPAIWRLSPAPVLILGGPDASGPTEFSNVYDATFWEGRLLLLDGATQTLRLFELPSGRHLRTFGHRGEGPGEFLNALHLQPLPGDSLFVSDLQASRFTIFDPQGRIERVVSLAVSVPGSRLTPLGRFLDGSILAWAPRFTDAAGPGLHHIGATIYHVRPDGTHADSLRVLPFTTVQPMRVGPAQGWRVALGAGQLFPAVTDRVAYFSSPTTYTVHTFDPQAGTWGIIQADSPPRLGGSADAETRRNAAVRHGASPHFMAQVSGVDTLPALLRPFVSSNGWLWVAEAATDSATRTRGLAIYTAAGQLQARLRVPSGLQILAVSDTYLVAKNWEPEAEELVYVYGITRSPR